MSFEKEENIKVLLVNHRLFVVSELSLLKDVIVNHLT